MDIKAGLSALGKFKYPLIVLTIGLAILLFPSASRNGEEAVSEENGLERVLSCTEGVGEVRVIISDKGVVVVCRGADNPKVRLDIIQAVSSYTGFSSDKITVLKMTDQRLGGD